MADSIIECGILGPLLLVTAQGRTVRLGADKQRVVMAALALRAGQQVSFGRLVDCIWGDDPPPTARATVQTYVKRIRQLVGTDGARLIRSVPDGYKLDDSVVRLDIARFRELVADAGARADAGEVTEESELLRAALAVWRGPALADVPSDTLHRDEVPQLVEEWLSASERRIDCDLRLGRHREVVSDLKRLTTAHPLQERFWGQLMLALHRSGRQAEALAAYRTVRTHLTGELGLEPGEGLQRLQAAILGEDARLAFAPPTSEVVTIAAPAERTGPFQLPADINDFVGREPQLEILLKELRHGDGTAVSITAVSGRAGVGKTALAVHAAHRLAADYPDGQLYVDLHGARPGSADPSHVLARFLRDLGVDSSRIPDDLEQRSQLYRSTLSGRRILVFLDNAADEEHVRPLLPGSATCGVLVTGRARMGGLAGARLVGLDVLDPDQAVELLERVIGPERVAAERPAAHDLTGVCGQLPLAVRIVAARLAAKPHWSLGRMVARLADERRRLDELSHAGLEVRASLALGYTDLDGAARAMFRRLGLLDAPDFAPWTGAALIGGALSWSEAVLERLVDAQLLDAYTDERFGSVRYRFHDLVRLYARERCIAEEPEADRTGALGRVLSMWLALTEHAHAAIQGGDFTIVHGGALRRAPEQSLLDRVGERPLAWYESERPALLSAIAQAAAAGDDELCWDLAVTAVSLFSVRSHYDEWAGSHTLALEAARDAGNWRGEAAVWESIGWLHLAHNRHEEAERSIESAIDLFRTIGDEHGLAISLRTMAYVNRLQGRYGRALENFEEALPTIEAVADHGARVGVLRGIGQIHLELGRLDLAADSLERAVVAAGEARHRRGGVQAMHSLGECRLAQGRFAAAEEIFGNVLEYAREIGDLKGEVNALLGLANVRLAQGRHDEAGPYLGEGFTISSGIGGGTILEARVLLAQGQLYLAQGNGPYAIDRILRACMIGRDTRSPVWEAIARTVLGDAHHASGDLSAARVAWRQALDLFTSIGAAQATDVARRLAFDHPDPARPRHVPAPPTEEPTATPT